jgi:hypothetical protein
MNRQNALPIILIGLGAGIFAAGCGLILARYLQAGDSGYAEIGWGAGLVAAGIAAYLMRERNSRTTESAPLVPFPSQPLRRFSEADPSNISFAVKPTQEVNQSGD